MHGNNTLFKRHFVHPYYIAAKAANLGEEVERK